MELIVKKAIVAHQEGRLKEAEQLYREILKKIEIDQLNIHNNLGNLLDGMNRLDEAETSFKKAIELQPKYAEAHNNLGIVQARQGEFEEAETSYRKAIELKPDYVDAYYNLAILINDFVSIEDAKIIYKKVIKLKPDHIDAHNNLGNILKKLGRLDEAETSYRKAIELKPDYVDAFKNLAITEFLQNKLVESSANYDHALAINPDKDYLLGDSLYARMHLCKWDNFSQNLHELIKKINKQKNVITPFSLLSLIDDPDIHRKTAEIYSNDKYPKSNFFPKLLPYRNHKKIKIGYFSPDFKNHPVAYLTAALYEIHDRNKFEIYAFSFEADTKDEFNSRIRAGADYFHNVQMISDLDVVKLTRSLEIDIAIDLAGFTGRSRTNIFAMSAAPIQVNYLGYPGTMATNYIDYLIADHTLIPNEKRKYYSEKIVFMPNSYQPNDAKTIVLKKSFTRKDFGLPNDKFVFCCMNQHYKINPNTFAGWMNILSKVKESVLWLPYGNITSVNNLKKEAKKFGISEDRLIFASHLPLREDHLSRIKLADLFLDTLPLNAHATANDALKMGLPVLTCTGSSFVSRVATSLLRAVNLPEMITSTQEEYEALAIQLATHPKKLKIIKDKLNTNLSTAPLYNASLYTQNLEAAYQIMYKRYQNGLAPDDISINIENN